MAVVPTAVCKMQDCAALHLAACARAVHVLEVLLEDLDLNDYNAEMPAAFCQIHAAVIKAECSMQECAASCCSGWCRKCSRNAA